MEEETHLVHPEPGVTLYAPGHRVPFEAGRPVPLPRAHAEALLASGHVRLHVPPAPAPEAPKITSAAPETQPEQPA